jgi:hypothetical protein
MEAFNAECEQARILLDIDPDNIAKYLDVLKRAVPQPDP